MKHLSLKFLASSGTVLYAAALIGVSTPAFAYDGEEYAPQAHVSIADAEALALKVRSGEITDKELEKEADGNELRYSFDIKSDGVTYEVGIDARTGAVLENAPEGSNPD